MDATSEHCDLHEEGIEPIPGKVWAEAPSAARQPGLWAALTENRENSEGLEHDARESWVDRKARSRIILYARRDTGVPQPECRPCSSRNTSPTRPLRHPT